MTSTGAIRKLSLIIFPECNECQLSITVLLSFPRQLPTVAYHSRNRVGGLTEDRLALFLESLVEVATMVTDIPHVFDFPRDPHFRLFFHDGFPRPIGRWGKS